MDIYQYLLITEFALAALVFVLLFFISAPYGKFGRSGWGISMPAKYGWLIMEMPALLVISFYFVDAEGWNNGILLIFFLIWQLHYGFRTLIYPFIMGGKDKPYPVLLVVFAIIFNTINGAVNGHYIFEVGHYGMSWLASAPFILGCLLYFIGYFINKQTDMILRNLRKTHEGYQIPRGGLFPWISSPHYFGEILQWLGWAILTWSFAGLAFACFTFANLAPRAISSHQWYKETFPEYPKYRKALIPFLW